MTLPTTLALAAVVLLLPQATVRAQAPTAKTGPATGGLRDLQGTWEGAHVGQESAGTITLTVTGNALLFQGSRADLRYDATFTLKKGTRPQQLHATITGGGPGNDVGRVIGAVFKIENGTLSLAGIEDDAPSTLDDAEAFDHSTSFHYRFRKVDPGAKTACTLKPEPTPSSAPRSPLKWPL
jgi:uncharacterized protein (TIGR03067 family)